MKSDGADMYTRYPNILVRLGAYLVDYTLLMLLLVLPQAVLAVLTDGFPFERFQNGWQIEGWILLTISLPTWLYFTLSEWSRRRATVGKQVLGLQVVSKAGGGISFRQALLRTAVKLLPWELTHLTLMLPRPLWWVPEPELRLGLIVANLLIGLYLVIMWRNRQRRSLHDLLADTVVVRAR